MEFQVMAKGNCRNRDESWILISRNEKRSQYHSVIYSRLNSSAIGDTIPIPTDAIPDVWHNSGQGIGRYIKELSYHSCEGYTLNSEMDFGLYRGLQVGMIYAFDIAYVGWLIKEVTEFYLQDLELLQLFGAFKAYNDNFTWRRYAGYIDPFMHEFDTIQEFASCVKVLNPEVKLPQDLVDLNHEKRSKG